MKEFRQEDEGGGGERERRGSLDMYSSSMLKIIFPNTSDLRDKKWTWLPNPELNETQTMKTTSQGHKNSFMWKH